MAAKGNTHSDDAAPDGVITSVQARNPFTLMISGMALEATMETEQEAFAGDDINLTAILTAETDDEIWDADERGPLGFRDLAGCEIEILALDVKFSRNATRPGGDEIKSVFVDPETGRQMYLLLTCVRTAETGDESKKIRLPEIGEQFQANTSARYLVAKLWRFYQLGRIDPSSGARLAGRIRATDLGGDQAVLKLRPIVKRSTTQA